MIILILLACVMMVFQDLTGTLCVMSESKANRWLAGLFDALGDFPRNLGYGISGATLAQRGFAYALLLATCVAVTSFFSTSYATKLGSKIK